MEVASHAYLIHRIMAGQLEKRVKFILAPVPTPGICLINVPLLRNKAYLMVAIDVRLVVMDVYDIVACCRVEHQTSSGLDAKLT